VILTNDNLAKRNWHDIEKCCFCHKNKKTKHLFFEYRFAREFGFKYYIWFSSTSQYSSYVWKLASGIWEDFKTFSSARNGSYLLVALVMHKCFGVWKKTLLLSYAGGIFGYPPASYMGYAQALVVAASQQLAQMVMVFFFSQAHVWLSRIGSH